MKNGGVWRRLAGSLLGTRQIYLCGAVSNKDEDSKVIIPPSVKTVGLRSFYGAKNITVETKNGILPKGFFKAIGYQVYSNNSYSAISVTVDGKTCMVPPDEENAKTLDVYFEFYPFDPEIIYQHYADLETETRGDFMAFVYFNSKNIREKEAAKKRFKTKFERIY